MTFPVDHQIHFIPIHNDSIPMRNGYSWIKDEQKIRNFETFITMDSLDLPKAAAFQHLDAYIQLVCIPAIQCSNLLYHL